LTASKIKIFGSDFYKNLTAGGKQSHKVSILETVSFLRRTAAYLNKKLELILKSYSLRLTLFKTAQFKR